MAGAAVLVGRLSIDVREGVRQWMSGKDVRVPKDGNYFVQPKRELEGVFLFLGPLPPLMSRFVRFRPCQIGHEICRGRRKMLKKNLEGTVLTVVFSCRPKRSDCCGKNNGSSSIFKGQSSPSKNNHFRKPFKKR